jgi:uncharacterized protein (DUF2336 family)
VWPFYPILVAQLSNSLVLVEKSDAAARVAAARAAVHALRPGPEHAEQRRAAEAVLTVLAEDADEEVRLEVARLLAPHPLAPRHVIMTLAADHVAISAMVLAQSPQLIDGELARLAKDGEPEAQIAIACRERLSVALGGAISENSSRDACLALVQNPSAALGANALHRIAERFGGDDEIRRNLLTQPCLSPKSRVLLIVRLGDKLVEDAASEGIAAARAQGLARDCCDKALIAYAADAADCEIGDICGAIIELERMNAAFLLRCVLSGNLELFSQAIARLSATPASRVEALLADGRENAFRAVCVRAGLPRPACEVLWRALTAWRIALADGVGGDATELVWRICQAALEAYQPVDDNDPVWVLLRKVGAEAAREKARADFRSALEPPAAAPPLEEAVPAQPPYSGEVLNVEPEVVAVFALHFAEEILDLEESLAGNVNRPAEAAPEMDILAAISSQVAMASEEISADPAVAAFAAMLEAEIANTQLDAELAIVPERHANDDGESRHESAAA